MDKEKASPSSCATEEATKEISRGRHLVALLRALLASWLAEDGLPESASCKFEAALSCLSAALSLLRSAERLEACHDKTIDQATTKNNSGIGHKRRRHQESWTTVTTVPFFDEYQWRKYGQKHIRNSQFQREFFRCSYDECEATKVVQQQNNGEPPEYTVSYGKPHSCKSYTGSNIDATNRKEAPNPIIKSNSLNAKKINHEEEPVMKQAVDAETPNGSYLIPDVVPSPDPIYSSAEWPDFDERNYFRCIYKNCETMKTVEQKNNADPIKYIITNGSEMSSTSCEEGPNPEIDLNSFNAQQDNHGEGRALEADAQVNISRLIMDAPSPQEPETCGSFWHEMMSRLQ